MYFISGRRACLETVQTLSRAELKRLAPGQSRPPPRTLKLAYNRTLQGIQPDVPISSVESLTTWLVTDQTGEAAAVGAVIDAPTSVDSGVWDWFRFIVNSVSCDPKLAGSGVSGAAVGAIRIGQPSTMTMADLKELLLSELARTLLFLDEWLYGHYQELAQLELAENYVVAPLSNISQPLDKVIQELIVGTEVLLYRELHAGQVSGGQVHAPSEELSFALGQAIASVYRLPNVDQLLTPRGYGLIDDCQHHLQSLFPRAVAA